jgi:hypothetical protein
MDDSLTMAKLELATQFATYGIDPEKIYDDSSLENEFAQKIASSFSAIFAERYIETEQMIIDKTNTYYTGDVTFDEALKKAFKFYRGRLEGQDGEQAAVAFLFGLDNSGLVAKIEEIYNKLPTTRDFSYTTPQVVQSDKLKTMWVYDVVDCDIRVTVTRQKTNEGVHYSFDADLIED